MLKTKQSIVGGVLGGMAILALLAGLAGCGEDRATAGEDDLSSAVEALESKWRDLRGEWAVAVEQESGGPLWLSLGEIDGARLQGQDGNTLAHWDRPLEYVDLQGASPGTDGVLTGQDVYASYDSRAGRPVLFTLDAQRRRFETLAEGEPTHYAVEDLCLYRGQDASLYLFMIGDDFRAHQLLVTRRGEDFELRPVRRLPVPPGGEYCAVDQATGTLYVSEEDSVVFAYDAHPETSMTRDIVEVASPWGNLGSGPRDLVSDQGELYAIVRGEASVHRILNDTGDHRHTGTLGAGQLEAPETLTLSQASGQRHLMVFDEASERYRHMMLAQVDDPPESSDQLPEVKASMQTEPVPSPGDAADDPAVWVHPGEPARSLILGTNKRAGLHVYNLKGEEVQFIGNGRVNNVDVRYGAQLGDHTVDVAAATNRSSNTVSLYAIDRESRRLELVTEVPTDLEEIYGFCLYQAGDGSLYGFANDKDGTFDQFELTVNGDTL